jgi:hypothetical protein
MVRKTISRQTYDMRRGDLVKFAGNRARQAPAWSPTAEGLRSQEDWIPVEAGEEMTLVGRLPYRCSYEWLLERRTPTDRGRWIVARDDQLAVVEAAFKMSVGRTAILKDGLNRGTNVTGDMVVITQVNPSRSGRWASYQTVSGIVSGTVHHGLSFYDMWVMLAGPDDYEDPDMPNIGGEE